MTVVDTDTLSLLENGVAAVVTRAAAADRDGPVVIALVTRIEKLRGRFDAVLKGATAAGILTMQARLAATEEFLTRFPVVEFDTVAGGHFDRLSKTKLPRSMSRDDLLIACIALAQRATLATRNIKDFRTIPGLKLVNWAD